MPTVNPKTYHLSASAIAAFKACPTRFRLAYREGLRPAEDTDSQRQGTTWHEMHEVYAHALRDFFDNHPEADDFATDNALNKVVQLLNDRYANCPLSKTPQEWALERQVLLTSFIGYQWYYQNDPVEVLASEVPFELPLTSPRTGLPLPTDEAVRVGKIDHIVRWQGAICDLERKSTSRSISADSDYWDKAKKDTQVSMYALAFRDLARFDDGYNWIGDINIGVERYGNTLYCVWHKPTIQPTILTQKETAEFLASGEYCGQKFEAIHWNHPDGSPAKVVTVNGEKCEIKEGKKGFAIKETIEMFAARLLADIQQRPDFYYQRREIARTDAELRQFQRQLYSVYQSMKACSKHDAWVENESACRATYPCPYLAVCYGPGADVVCDGQTTPQGYKRIFVDLTVHGQGMEE